MPATGDRITKRKDGLFQGMYTAHTPDGPKRKYVYGRKEKDVERRLAEAMGDAARGIVFDAERATVAAYMERWLEKRPQKGRRKQEGTNLSPTVEMVVAMRRSDSSTVLSTFLDVLGVGARLVEVKRERGEPGTFRTAET